MLTEPLVSVVTPVYNTELYLAECIESVLSQTYTHWEYIIVNNCSTDRTLDIAQSFANKDPRIRIHNNAQLVNIMTNHNIGLSLISPQSKYCKLVCADDWLFPDCVKQMVSLAEANPTVGIVAAYQINSQRIKNVGVSFPTTVIPGKEISRSSLLGGPYVFANPTSLLYRSDLVRSTKEFYPSESPHSDTAACYAQLEHCDFGFVHQILAYERLHTGQTSEKSRIFNYYVAENLLYLAEYGPKYLTEEELQKRARQRLVNYYKFLGKSFLQSRDKEFWEYHKRQLKKAGYPLRRAVLAKAVIAEILDKLLNPKRTIEGLFSN